MKKLVLALATSLTLFGLYSCSNGKYDANPDADYSNIPNPVKPIDGTPAKEGQIKFKLYDEYQLYTTAFYIELGQVRLISGFRMGTSNNYTVGLTLNNYQGVGEYDGVNDNATGSYSIFKDTTLVKHSEAQQSIHPLSHIKVNVKEDTGDRLSGTFEFTGINTYGGGDSSTILDGSFNVKKQ